MKKILLIDDDNWLAASYAKLLADNYFVTVVSDAGQAVDKVDELSPDLILADVMLEGHTVIALLNELQSYSDTKKIPVVLCSALDDTVFQSVDLKQYGVAAVLDKSRITPEELISAIDEVLQ